MNRKLWTYFVVLTILSSMFIVPVNASAETVVMPGIFASGQNGTQLFGENFESSAVGTYTNSNVTVALTGTGVTKSGSVNVAQESGNKYLSIVSCEPTDKLYPTLTTNHTNTTSSVLLSFDYRNVEGSLEFYEFGNYTSSASNWVLTSGIKSDGTLYNRSLENAQNSDSSATDGTTKTVYNALPMSEDDWTNFKALYVTSQHKVHFYVNNQYIASSDFRREALNLRRIMFGSKGGGAEIDNIFVTDVGTDDIYYNYKTVKEYLFNSGTTSPFTEEYTVGTGTITSDGRFKMVSDSNTNLETKHYNLNLSSADALSGYSKISFDWCIEDYSAGDSPEPAMRMYLWDSNKIATTIAFYKNMILANKTNGTTDMGVVATGIEPGNHHIDILLNIKDSIIYYVVDDVVSNAFPFRNNPTKIDKIFFRIESKTTNDAAYIDNLGFYTDNTKYFQPNLSAAADKFVVDNSAKTITITENVAAGYSDMDDIVSDIVSDKSCTFKVNDADSNGCFSDGDTITVTENSTGVGYTYVIEVLRNFETQMQALIVKGSNGQGDDFYRVDTITKSGNALVELRVFNNTESKAIPAVIAAVYVNNALTSVYVSYTAESPRG